MSIRGTRPRQLCPQQDNGHGVLWTPAPVGSAHNRTTVCCQTFHPARRTQRPLVQPFLFLLPFFAGSFFNRFRFWLFPPLTLWFLFSVGSRSISSCSFLSGHSSSPVRASPQSVSLPAPGKSRQIDTQRERGHSGLYIYLGEHPAHVPPAVKGSGRLGRKVWSLTMSPFSEVAPS